MNRPAAPFSSIPSSSRTSLPTWVESVKQEVMALLECVDALSLEVAWLQSGNTKLKAPLSQPSGKGKPKGGQFGHDGRALELVASEAEDHTERLRPAL